MAEVLPLKLTGSLKVRVTWRSWGALSELLRTTAVEGLKVAARRVTGSLSNWQVPEEQRVLEMELRAVLRVSASMVLSASSSMELLKLME